MASAEQFETSPEAFARARHVSRYAHADSVVWGDRGVWFTARYSRDALKAAMLACGTKRRFYVIHGKTPFNVAWREAILRFRNAHRLCSEVL